jgi:hypothetical protein
MVAGTGKFFTNPPVQRGLRTERSEGLRGLIVKVV